MGKYAVCVGVNYTANPEAALKGCVNDTHISKAILLSKGFEEENIRMLNDEGGEDPTGVNVKKALHWLCSNRSEDDYIFFHFSGHGTQVPADDDDHEEDNKDEALCCAGLFLLADDDFKQFFTMLPEGCQATVITDCCHSGGMLDHKEVAIEGDKKDDASNGSRGTAPDSQARSLPVSTIASFLSQKLGKTVSPTSSGINGGMASIFGGDAGKLAMKFAASQMKGGGGGGGNPLTALLGGAGGAGGGAAALAGMLAGSGGSKAGGGANPLAGILSELGLSGTESATGAGAPPYVPTENPLSDDTGVLITGCMAHQTSADVRPPGGRPHGALTNALKTVYNRNPEASYRELVLGVRAELLKQGHSQSPQLECSQGNADKPFICPGGRETNPADEEPTRTKIHPSASPTAAPSGDGQAPSGDSAPAPGGGGGLAKLFKACFKG